jgi:hypothetical protein
MSPLVHSLIATGCLAIAYYAGRFLAHTSIIEHLFDVMIDDLMTKLEKDGYLKIVRGEDGERELVSIAEIEDKACRKLVEDVKKLEKVKENG